MTRRVCGIWRKGAERRLSAHYGSGQRSRIVWGSALRISAISPVDIRPLKGEKSNDHEEKEEQYHLVERRYGSFRRSVSLGFMPDKGKVQAQFKDGVLKLHIEKPEGAANRTRRIKIGKN